MGWKASAIIISGTKTYSEETLKNLGFANLEKIEDEPFETAIYPEPYQIFIGTYKDNLIITHPDLPEKFLEQSLTDFEEKLISLFPNSEICAISLNSTINHWGFAIIKDGKKIRVKAGDSDNGTFINEGEPLEEELTLLSKSKIDENGQRRYYLGGYNEEPYFEEQVGENFVFNIVKRYIGKQLDEDDDLLFDTFLKGYQSNHSSDVFFSGEWEGSYSLGEGYSEKLKGRNENFVLKMNVINGELSGICIDANKQADEPATIQGFIIERFIGFLKHYPVKYRITENGIEKKSSEVPNSIGYSGIFDPVSLRFKGTWKIENTSCWGKWMIKRK